jgi:hypothetical protein
LNRLLHRTRQGIPEEDERFLKLLDEELAEGFPNPNRIGCPDSEFLQRLARHRVPISDFDRWIDHLGSCSECFGEFNRLTMATKARRGQQRFALYAVAACIILAGVGLLWKQSTGVQGISRPARLDATNPAVLGSRGNGRQDVASTAADRNPFEVLLNLTQSPTRGENSTDASRTIRMPARLLECRMFLPLGSSDGLYYIQVRRADRSEVLKTAQGTAAMKDGDLRLDVELDLSNISAGAYLLSYRRAGESWHRVSILITN